jgi:hypothetical protein
LDGAKSSFDNLQVYIYHVIEVSKIIISF